MKYLKWIGLILIVSMLSFALYIGYSLRIDETTSIGKDKEYSLDELRTSNPFKGNEPLHIIVFGIDETATTDMSAEENPKRSDVVMLFTIDPVQKKAQLLSLPRDTYIKVPGHKGKTKLGHAFAYGGVELATQTVEDFMGVEVDYHAIVNYDAVRRLVDAVGGVEVDVPFDYKYEDTYVVPNLIINFKKGKQVLNGDDAVRFLRIRKIYENQDIDRIQVQQGFLMKIFDKMKNPTMLFKIPELIDIVQDNVETDLNYGQIAYLAKMGLGFEKEDIVKDTLVGEGERINGIDYYVVDQDSAIEQYKRFLSGKGSYYEELGVDLDGEKKDEENNKDQDQGENGNSEETR